MKFLLCLFTFYIGFGSVDVQANDGGDFFRPKPEQAGAWVTGTQGEIWPKPLLQNSSDNYLIVHPKTFKILVSFISLIQSLKFYFCLFMGMGQEVSKRSGKVKDL